MLALTSLIFALGVLFIWPQAIQSLRTRSVTGLSSVSIGAQIPVGLAWGAFGLHEHAGVIIASQAQALVALGIITCVLLVCGEGRGLLRGIILTGTPLLAAYALGGIQGLVWMAGAGVVMMLAPQALAAVRSRNILGGLSGVSLVGAWASLSYTLAWGLWGVLTETWVTLATQIALLPVVTCTLWYVSRDRRRVRASGVITLPQQRVELEAPAQQSARSSREPSA